MRQVEEVFLGETKAVSASWFTCLLRLTYPRLAAGVGSGNSTVDHACKLGRILGSVTGNAIKRTTPVDSHGQSCMRCYNFQLAIGVLRTFDLI